jgi:hypothetical protein
MSDNEIKLFIAACIIAIAFIAYILTTKTDQKKEKEAAKDIKPKYKIGDVILDKSNGSKYLVAVTPNESQITVDNRSYMHYVLKNLITGNESLLKPFEVDNGNYAISNPSPMPATQSIESYPVGNASTDTWRAAADTAEVKFRQAAPLPGEVDVIRPVSKTNDT